ncbi:hypothetical protein GO281_03747 [Ralstonia solanacearum]|nr:hypothetical protein [Ralstonia solanacearum]NKF73000.1 hypothetical protein [Ralstonia solanacearum]
MKKPAIAIRSVDAYHVAEANNMDSLVDRMATTGRLTDNPVFAVNLDDYQ